MKTPSITIILILPLLLYSFQMKSNSANPISHTYILHYGADMYELVGAEEPVIKGNSLTFISSLKSIKPINDLRSLDSCFSKYIVEKCPPDLSNTCKNLEHFAVPIGNNKYSIQPIEVILPGRRPSILLYYTHNPLSSRTFSFDPFSKSVGLFKIKERPVYIIVAY